MQNWPTKLAYWYQLNKLSRLRWSLHDICIRSWHMTAISIFSINSSLINAILEYERVITVLLENLALNLSQSSHVTSSANELDHWTKTFTAAQLFFLTSWRSQITMGSNLILPSSPTVGKADWLTAFSPIFFLRQDTWKIGWICTSASKSRRYATLPIHWSTWNGPQKRGDNDKFFHTQILVCLKAWSLIYTQSLILNSRSEWYRSACCFILCWDYVKFSRSNRIMLSLACKLLSMVFALELSL